MIKPIIIITLILLALWLTGCWGYKEKPLIGDCPFGFKSYICRGKQTATYYIHRLPIKIRYCGQQKGKMTPKKSFIYLGRKIRQGYGSL